MRFGVSALVGFVIGIALVIWVDPAPDGVGFIVMVAIFLTIIVTEVVRKIVTGLGWLGSQLQIWFRWLGRGTARPPPPPTKRKRARSGESS